MSTHLLFVTRRDPQQQQQQQQQQQELKVVTTYSSQDCSFETVNVLLLNKAKSNLINYSKSREIWVFRIN